MYRAKLATDLDSHEERVLRCAHVEDAAVDGRVGRSERRKGGTQQPSPRVLFCEIASRLHEIAQIAPDCFGLHRLFWIAQIF